MNPQQRFGPRDGCKCLIRVMVCALTLAPSDRGMAFGSEAVRRPARLVALARDIEPQLKGHAERLPQYVQHFRQRLANDARLFAFDVTAELDSDGRVRLAGFVEFEESCNAIATFLEILGFAVDNRLQQLPTAELGDRKFGLVSATHTLAYDRPHGSRSVVTDCLFAEPLFLLREQEEQLLVHSGDGYLGWVAAADVRRVDNSGFERYLGGPRIRITTPITLGTGASLPIGAQLKWIGDRLVEAEVHAELPDGTAVALPRADCEVRLAEQPAADEIIATARQFLGTRYLWGGKTAAGIDCSGLVQVAYAAAGYQLPRDSNQQFLLGRLIATRWHLAGLHPGDTLYFLGSHGRIRHTGIYIGGDRYLHAQMPVVAISSLNPEHDDYDARRRKSFAFAKRLLD